MHVHPVRQVLQNALQRLSGLLLLALLQKLTRCGNFVNLLELPCRAFYASGEIKGKFLGKPCINLGNVAVPLDGCLRQLSLELPSLFVNLCNVRRCVRVNQKLCLPQPLKYRRNLICRILPALFFHQCKQVPSLLLAEIPFLCRLLQNLANLFFPFLVGNPEAVSDVCPCLGNQVCLRLHCLLLCQSSADFVHLSVKVRIRFGNIL